MKPTICVVDDDPGLLSMLSHALARTAGSLRLYSDPVAALPEIVDNPPDILLLDLNMPNLSGYELCRKLREDGRTSSLPIIMVTAVSSPDDRVRGFQVGADDYINKPFHLPELIARIGAVLRRAPSTPPHKIVAGEVEIDQRARDVRVRGERVELTLREYEILRLLCSEPGRTFDRDEIKDLISRRNADLYATTNVVAMHMMNLRRKIEVDPDHPRMILTVRQVGYRFVLPEQESARGASRR